MTYLRSLSAAGFAATAISFGPARMGFGLFVPEFRAEFSMSMSMSTSTVGYVSSLGFLGFFLGLLAAQGLLLRRGPGLAVLSGLVAATAGLATVALAPNVFVLAAGVVLAASSAGFAWTPFNDAVHRKIREIDRPTALSHISTGTSVGIAVAGLLALTMALSGIGWRLCWAIFAGLGVVALVANRASLRHVEKAADNGPSRSWRDLVGPGSFPLFAVAFVIGNTSAIYIAFAADHFSDGGVSGIPAAATAAAVFIGYGVFGLAGLFTGRLQGLLGLRWLLCLLFVAGAVSAALVALLPGSLMGLVASAGLQGINVMMTSAVLAFWSERLFPAFPSLGFTAVLLATASGNIIGPAAAGAISDAWGAGPMFLATAALSAIAAVAVRAGTPLNAVPGSQRSVA